MLEIFLKPTVQYPVNPRFRAYGKARIDIAQRAATRADWDRLWKKSTFPFPFSWGQSWKQCIEYKVEDFPAEVGFFIDILGFPVNAFDPDYAMFTSPGGEFFFSVVPALDGEQSTPPHAIRLQFMVARIIETAVELQRRGVVFEQWPAPAGENSSTLIGSFRTPHGIGIDLWGVEDDLSQLEDENQLEMGDKPLLKSPEYHNQEKVDVGENGDNQLIIFDAQPVDDDPDEELGYLPEEDRSSELEYISEEDG